MSSTERASGTSMKSPSPPKGSTRHRTFTRRVYIAGPISKGDLEHNLRQADEAMRELIRREYAPFNPMLSCYAGVGLKGPSRKGEGTIFADVTHEEWLAMDLPWVAAADAVLRLPGESMGADIEVRHAESLGIPVFTTLEGLYAYFR